MHLDLDILVYAVVAILLLGRLWMILGKRSEGEPRRQNPFVAPPPKPPAATPPPSSGAVPFRPLLEPPPASLAGGLASVAKALSDFDEKAFVQKAREVFEDVVQGYASEKTELLAPHLSPALFASFMQAIEARHAAGQTAQTRILRIRETEVMAARVESGHALITLRFLSDQENILRDSENALIGGGVGKIAEVSDIWVFARATDKPTAPWLVVETR